MIKIFLLVALTAFACRADLYNNTVIDQQLSVFYSSGFTQFGDQIQLVSPGLLHTVETQFYNNGSDASFDATLTFYNTGSPVGSQIGSSFTVTGILIAGFTSQTVTFANLGALSVPASVIVAFSVQNVSDGGDIGLNIFDPPSVGTSDSTFFMANDGTGLAPVSTLLNIDNVYLRLDDTVVSTVPEPSGATLLFGVGVVVAVSLKRRRVQ